MSGAYVDIRDTLSPLLRAQVVGVGATITPYSVEEKLGIRRFLDHWDATETPNQLEELYCMSLRRAAGEQSPDLQMIFAGLSRKGVERYTSTAFTMICHVLPALEPGNFSEEIGMWGAGLSAHAVSGRVRSSSLTTEFLDKLKRGTPPTP